ncbi:uncharacterized protein K444DRAFT_634416 [Hyaloscypha bicolor E]|uniref:Uncharacterized protein n=1 Tax=Hyaloscypha bicolor E TaxID=1095630 RepID=A0A2J6SVB6_9HELO|nr:uncharacterized protein K444DRAFT_634416 [Hyaloscypha bicolor E]PMD54717.1 hypothetical protein K444DRAFT_634416 [Hyaloscypha bicolor E]
MFLIWGNSRDNTSQNASNLEVQTSLSGDLSIPPTPLLDKGHAALKFMRRKKGKGLQDLNGPIVVFTLNLRGVSASALMKSMQAQRRAILNKGDRILCLKTETATCPDLDFGIESASKDESTARHNPCERDDSDIDTSTIPTRWITREERRIAFPDQQSLNQHSSTAQHSTAQHSTSHIATLQYEHEHERLAASAIARQLQPLSDQPLWGRVNSNSPTWRSHARCRLETPLLAAFPLPPSPDRAFDPSFLEKAHRSLRPREGGGEAP